MNLNASDLQIHTHTHRDKKRNGKNWVRCEVISSRAIGKRLSHSVEAQLAHIT